MFREIDSDNSGSITRMEVIVHLHTKAMDVAQSKGKPYLQKVDALT